MSGPPPGKPETSVLEGADPAPNAQAQREIAEDDAEEDARQQRQQIIDLFADDPVAQVIVEGLLEGTKREDQLSIANHRTLLSYFYHSAAMLTVARTPQQA